MQNSPSSTNTGLYRNGLIVLLLVLALARVALVFLHEANWDEYLNLSMIYDHKRGDLDEVLQTSFIYLFYWLPHVSDIEADQIVAARIVFLAVAVVTTLAIWKVARTLASTEAAFFAILCYWAYSFNLIHSVALRTDPLSACAMMCALWIVVARPLHVVNAIAAGVLIGLAGVITIKAIFYLPAIVTVALIRGIQCEGFGRIAKLILVSGMTAGVVFFGIIILHALTFEDVASPFAFLRRTTNSTLSTQEYGILWYYIKRGVTENFLISTVLVTGLLVLLSRLSVKQERPKALIGIALLTPLLSVSIYRDVYPYFFPFILAPAMILAALAWDAVAARYGPRPAFLSALFIAVGGLWVAVEKQAAAMSKQRDTLAVVHSLFPTGTHYVDGRSMVSSLPKSGLFMSDWGMTDYRNIGQPVMERIVKTDQPQFLLANTWHLGLDRLSPEVSQGHAFGLLAADLEFLQDNYLPFWGPLYVPGQELDASQTNLDIRVSAVYRYESAAPMVLDGKELLPGATIKLTAGNYPIQNNSAGRLILNVEVPRQEAPSKRLFEGF